MLESEKINWRIFLAALALTGAVEVMQRLTPKPLVRGIQLGVGLKLAALGIAWVGDLYAKTASDDLALSPIAAENLGNRWRQIELFASSSRLARQIWVSNVTDGAPRIGLDRLQEFA